MERTTMVKRKIRLTNKLSGKFFLILRYPHDFGKRNIN